MSVEPFELVALYAALRETHDLPALMDALIRRTRTFGKLLAESEGATATDSEIELALHRYFAQGIPCVFLGGEGLCSVHPARPLACRMYFSLSDPQYCAAEHLETPQNKGLIVYLPDELEEAIADLSDRFAPLDLPESLYAGLEKMNLFESIMLCNP
jgi:Fe-S-cluster containining protein